MDAGVTVIDQRVDIAVGDGVNAAPAAAVTAIGSSAWHEFFAAKAGDAIAAFTCVDLDPCFIDEFHGIPNKKGPVVQQGL